jgi:septal ring factor EnvC (AmiA/AmiB activator)
MSEGKLKLKPDKTRKAKQAIENILNKSSLTGLHQKCINVNMQKSQLSMSEKVAETRSDLSRLQGHLESLERRSKSVETEENAVEKAHSETLERIHNHKNQIEKNIFSFMGKRVHIE